MSLISRVFSSVPSLAILARSDAMVRSSAAGCSAISASINDIGLACVSLSCGKVLRNETTRTSSLANTLTRSLAFGVIVLVAQIVSAQDRISIIPQPRQMTANGETFRLERAHIVLADPRSAEDRFGATDFAAEVKQVGINLKVRGGRDRKAIVIGVSSLPAVQRALKELKIDVPASLDADVDMRTVNGSLSADFPITLEGRVNPRRIRATIGKGGRRIRLETVNGSVELKKAS